MAGSELRWCRLGSWLRTTGVWRRGHSHRHRIWSEREKKIYHLLFPCRIRGIKRLLGDGCLGESSLRRRSDHLPERHRGYPLQYARRRGQLHGAFRENDFRPGGKYIYELPHWLQGNTKRTKCAGSSSAPTCRHQQRPNLRPPFYAHRQQIQSAVRWNASGQVYQGTS